MNVNKVPQDESGGTAPNVAETKRGYSSWWYWRRSGGGAGVANEKQLKLKEHENKDGMGELNAVGTQTSRSNTPIDGQTKMTSPIDDENKMNISGKSDLSDLNKSQELSEDAHNEMYRKSLRLTTEQIVSYPFFFMCN